MSDPVPAVSEASTAGETQSLGRHPPRTQRDVSGAPDRVAPTVNRAAITISIMLATIMQAIDTTIANVALPHIQGSLSAAQDQITWVLTSYIVAAAIMTPLTGWLAGAFGIKRVFLIFADIRLVLGVDVVNLIWRHLATIPGALPWAWGTLRPLYADGSIAAEAAALHGDLDLPRLPSRMRNPARQQAVDNFTLE